MAKPILKIDIFLPYNAIWPIYTPGIPTLSADTGIMSENGHLSDKATRQYQE